MEIWITMTNIFLVLDILFVFKASRGATARGVTVWVRFPFEEMNYLLKFIFPFHRSGVEVKRGVEFCHSTRNASGIRQKVGNGMS